MVGIDARFLRWRENGDLAELAAVYDEAAPVLLRLALHHVRQPATAEDLVQTTFLAAIASADRWDAARPLAGWLAGILANHARWLMRSEGRRIDAARIDRAPAPDPLANAAAAEFTARCDAAIEALPAAYWPVLRLHLRHELEAAEIAHVLGRPPGTVRSQIARGLALLRAALPAGVALGAFAAIAPARGIAAVRAEVLASAATSFPTVAASGGGLLTLGALLMTKTTAVCAGALAAAGLFLAYTLPQPAPPAAPPAATTTGTLAAATLAVDRSANAPSDDARNVDRVDAAVADRQPGPTPTGFWQLAGRVQRAGAPLAGAVVHATCEVAAAEFAARAVADATGRYTIDLEPLRRLPHHQRAAVQLHVEARAAGSRNPSPSWQRLEHHDAERSLLTTVDFELVRGATVRLRVVDRHGVPVPAASAHMLVAGLDVDTANRVAASGIADADGFVHLSTASDGNVAVACSHPEHGAADVRCTLRAGDETDLGDVVLRNVAVLQGRVHDEDGAPAAGVEVAIVRDDGERLRHCATVTTDAAGRVRYAATAMGRHWLRAVAAGANATSAAFHGPAAALVEAPAEAVLTLVGLRRIAVEVTDPAGEPFVGRDFTVDAWLPGVGPSANLAPAERAKTPPDDSGSQSVWPAGALWPVGAVLGIRCIADAEQLSAAALVTVAEGPAVQTVSLRLTAPSLGTVEVVWAGQDGGFDRELGDFVVALEPLRFGSADHMLDSGSLERTEQGFVVPCDSGRYRLALRPACAASFGWFEPIATIVDVPAAGRVAAQVQPRLGGRVRVTLRAHGSNRVRPDEVRIARIDATPTPDAGREFLIDGRGSELAGPAPLDEPLAWSPLLRPGRHVLSITASGYAPATVAVDVRAGAFSDVAVELVRQ